MPLTDTQLRNLKPGGRAYRKSDGGGWSAAADLPTPTAAERKAPGAVSAGGQADLFSDEEDEDGADEEDV